jgi:cytochrome c554/c'-like protein
MRLIRVLTAGALIAGAVAGVTYAAPQGAKPAAANQYIGAAKCKNCHNAASSGDQYGKWKEQKHAKAFETLATADAKKIAKDKGIDDPQKADACLKCHATAFKEDPAKIMKGFDANAGVQCESCHGPGQNHMKARMKAAAAAGEPADGKAAPRVEVPKDEILSRPEMAACTTCHNKESPSYKPFCMKKFSQEIAHLDPRDPKAAEDLKNVKCDCDECKKAGGK